MFTSKWRSLKLHSLLYGQQQERYEPNLILAIVLMSKRKSQ